jgi:hypothetical protein
MRRFVLVIVVLAVWFAGDRIASRLLAAVLDHSSDPIARLYAGRARGDIVLIGNSRAYRGFDPDVLSREFGGSIVNLTLPGASIEVSEALVEDYLDRYGSPRLLIVELSGLMMDPDTVKELRIFAGRSNRIAELLRTYYPRIYYAGRVTNLFDFNNGMALNMADKIFRPMPDLRLDNAMSASMAMNAPEGTYFVPRANDVAAARRLIALIRARGIDVRFVLMPVATTFAQRNRLDDLRETAQRLTHGYRLWDFTQGPPTEPRHFADYVHLNRDGVGAFMTQLARTGFYTAPR